MEPDPAGVQICGSAYMVCFRFDCLKDEMEPELSVSVQSRFVPSNGDNGVKMRVELYALRICQVSGIMSTRDNGQTR